MSTGGLRYYRTSKRCMSHVRKKLVLLEILHARWCLTCSRKSKGVKSMFQLERSREQGFNDEKSALFLVGQDLEVHTCGPHEKHGLDSVNPEPSRKHHCKWVNSRFFLRTAKTLVPRRVKSCYSSLLNREQTLQPLTSLSMTKHVFVYWNLPKPPILGSLLGANSDLS